METRASVNGPSRPFIIDNNNSVDRKSISIFKDIPFIDGKNHIDLKHKVKVKNVAELRVSYSLIDVPHETYNGEVGVTPYKGIVVTVYNRGTNVVKETKNLLNGKNISRQTTFRQILGSFSYSSPVDIEVEVELDSGYTRALLTKIDRETLGGLGRCCRHSCGGGAPPPPPTIYSSLFEHMDLFIEYNSLSGTNKEFHNFETKFNEFKEGGNTYSFSKEFEVLNDKNFSRIVFGLNSNYCADLSHYNSEWNPKSVPEKSLEETGRPDNIPCQRTHIIGDLLSSKDENIFDFSEGELLEEPYDSDVVTEQNIATSQKYFEVDIRNIVNGISTVYSQRLCHLEEDDGVEFININIKVRKDETKIYIIPEFLCRVEVVDGFNNDRLRFKSDIAMGCLFIA